MALNTNTRLGIAVAVLAAALGGLYVMMNQRATAHRTHTAEGRAASLPTLPVGEVDIELIDRVVIEKPAGEDGSAASKFVLVKEGEDWKLTEPGAYKANAANVKSLVSTLAKLQVKEQLSASPDAYAANGVSDDKGVKVSLFKGGQPAEELIFGNSGSRGQLARLGGNPGVYVVKGYSKYSVERDLKGWRDLSIFTLDDAQAKDVTVTNPDGTFSFVKEGDTWSGKYGKDGKSAATKPIPKFDPEKVGDLLRAFKTLNAADFADGKTAAETGLDKPIATVKIVLADGATRELLVGNEVAKAGASPGGAATRYAKLPGAPEIFEISSWVGSWALGGASKYEQAEPPPAQ